MSIPLIQQYIYEVETWHRLLDYLEDGNILYRHRLAVILKNDTESTLDEMIESFLNKFMLEDAIILLFRDEITKAKTQMLEMGKEVAKEGNFGDFIFTQDKLREEIKIIEQRFNRLKFELDKYLSDHFTTIK
ncbi:MAG: hypothetical protein V4539_16000 [Bacteroidota bacterium]